MIKKEFISAREFAKRLNVSEGAVRKAIARGDLDKCYDKKQHKVEYVSANQTDWAESQKIVKAKPGISRVKAIEKLENEPIARVKPCKKSKPVKKNEHRNLDDFDDLEELDELKEELNNDEVDLQVLIANIKITSNLNPKETMRRREIIELALAKIKLQEAEKNLVRRDEVERALFNIGSELKKALFNLPNRLVREIMVSSNEVEALNIFNKEMKETLDTYGSLEIKF